jgi:hypothetical protein
VNSFHSKLVVARLPGCLAVILPLLCGFIEPVDAAPPWQDAVRAMPLPATTPLLNRDNAAGMLLQSFHSNEVVKGLLILPDVFDDLYLINRDQPALNIRATNLLDALVQFTNRTALRLTFREPFLMVYIASDRLEPGIHIEDSATVQRLKAKRVGANLLFADTHWERLQPRLGAELDCKILPGAASQEAWHFARHNFAACNLTGWQLLEAMTLTGKTTATVQKQAIVFREFSGN